MPTVDELMERWGSFVKDDPATLRAAYMSAHRILALLDTPGGPNSPTAVMVPSSNPAALSTGLALGEFAYLTEDVQDADLELKVETSRVGGVTITLGSVPLYYETWPAGKVIEFALSAYGNVRFKAADTAPIRVLPIPPTTTTTTTEAPATTTTTTTAAPQPQQGTYRYTAAIKDYAFLSGDEVKLVDAASDAVLVDYRPTTAQEVKDGRAEFVLTFNPGDNPVALKAFVRRAGQESESAVARLPLAGPVPAAPLEGQQPVENPAATVAPLADTIEMEAPPAPTLTPGPALWMPVTTTTTQAPPAPTTTTTTTETPVPAPAVDVLRIRNRKSHNEERTQNAQNVIEAIRALDGMRLGDLDQMIAVFFQDDYRQAAASLQAVANSMPAKAYSARWVGESPWDVTADTLSVTFQLGAQVASASKLDFLSSDENAKQLAGIAAAVLLKDYEPLSTQRIKDAVVQAHIKSQAAQVYLNLGNALFRGAKTPEMADAVLRDIGKEQGTILVSQAILEGCRLAMIQRGKESTYDDFLQQTMEKAREVLTEDKRRTDDIGYFRNNPEAVRKVVERVSVKKDLSRYANQHRYAFAQNRSLYDAKTAADLARHGEVTTNPKVKGAIDQAQATANAKADASKAAADGAAADVKAQGGDPAAPANVQDPNNKSGLMKAIAQLFKPSDLPNIEFTENTLVVPPLNEGVAGVGDKLRPTITRVTTSISQSALNITNMFDPDFNDFRRTGIVKALYNLQGSEDHINNRQNLASIMVVPDSMTPGKDGNIAEAFEPFPGAGLTNSYNSFMLTSVRESYAEKVQIVETLGDGVAAFFFGERPEVWSITGVLLNDLYSDQVYRFRKLYHEVLRGSVLAKNRRKAVISVPSSGLIVRGYPIALDLPHESNSEEMVQFTLQFWVTEFNTSPLISLVTSDEERTFVATMTVLDGGSIKGGKGVADGVRKYLRNSAVRGDKSIQDRVMDQTASLLEANGSALSENIVRRSDGVGHGGTMTFGDPHGHVDAQSGGGSGTGVTAKHAGGTKPDGSKARPQGR